MSTLRTPLAAADGEGQPAAPPPRHQPRPHAARGARAALTLGAGLAYLIWISGGELTGWLPGGQATAFALAGALALAGAAAPLARPGALARRWSLLRAKPAVALLPLLLLLAVPPRLVAIPGVVPTAAMRAAEQASLIEAHRMVTTGQFRPATFERPGALLAVQALAGGAAFLGGAAIDRWREVGDLRPADLATPARLLNALLGILSVALAYACAGRLGGRRAGVLAAAILAASPLAWLAARVATEDALAGAALLAALWAIAACRAGQAGAASPAEAAGRGTMARVPGATQGAAFLIGIAAAIRPTLLLLVLALLVARWPFRGAGRARGGALALVAGVAGFLIAMPHALVALPAALDAAAAAIGAYDLRLAPDTPGLLAGHLPAALLLLVRADPLLAVAGSVGGLIAASRHRRADLLLLAFLLPSLALALLHRTLDLRQILPYAPAIALLGGLGLDGLWRMLPRRAGRRRRGRRAAATGRRPPAP